MTKQNSFLAKILGQSQPEPESSIYALLDRTDRTLKKYFACPDDKSYQTQLLSNLYEEIEWASKNFVNTSDITYMMTIPISTKDQFLKDFFDFFMSIRIWVQETIQTGKPSNGQKDVLKTTLDGLFCRWSAMLRNYNYVIEKQRLKAAKKNQLWSKPMTKTRMMTALGIPGIDTFNSYANRHGIQRINRKTFQLCIDNLSPQEIAKLEKA